MGYTPVNGWGWTGTFGNTTNSAGKTTNTASSGVVYNSGPIKVGLTGTQTNGDWTGFMFTGTLQLP
jgi:hypothetical protein